MIRLLLILTLLLTTISRHSIGQVIDENRLPVLHFVEDESVESQEQVVSAFEEQIISLKRLIKKNGVQERFLKRLFYKTQRDLLWKYENNTRLKSLFDGSKDYDCVTGTAIYALYLDALDIDYSIKETDFHVYLIVHLPRKDILFESTDAIYGYIDNPVIIGDRIKLYRNGGQADGTIASTSYDGITPTDYRIDRVITLKQLAGLQYYNLALNAFNNGDHSAAMSELELALELYPNDRFFGFREILLVEMSQPMSTIYSPVNR